MQEIILIILAVICIILTGALYMGWQRLNRVEQNQAELSNMLLQLNKNLADTTPSPPPMNIDQTQAQLQSNYSSIPTMTHGAEEEELDVFEQNPRSQQTDLRAYINNTNQQQTTGSNTAETKVNEESEMNEEEKTDEDEDTDEEEADTDDEEEEADEENMDDEVYEEDINSLPNEEPDESLNDITINFDSGSIMSKETGKSNSKKKRTPNDPPSKFDIGYVMVGCDSKNYKVGVDKGGKKRWFVIKD